MCPATLLTPSYLLPAAGSVCPAQATLTLARQRLVSESTSQRGQGTGNSMVCRHRGLSSHRAGDPARGSRDLYHLTKDPALCTETPVSCGETRGPGKWDPHTRISSSEGQKKKLKIKTSFIEIYLTYNKLHIFKVYNVVKLWHMYIPGTHHHNQNNKLIHHPIHFIGGTFSGGLPVEDSRERCNFRHGH